jgi:hypothetical protein
MRSGWVGLLFAISSVNTFALRNSHASASRKNPVTLIRMVLNNPVNSSVCISRYSTYSG